MPFAFVEQPLLQDLIFGTHKSQILYVTTKLGVPDLLKDGPKLGSEIAHLLGKKHVDRVEQLLRVAAAIGIYHRDPVSLKYSLNSVSTPLLEGPNTLRYAVLGIAQPALHKAFMELESSIDGEYAYEKVFGCGMYDFLNANAEAGEFFSKAMTAFTRNTDTAVALTSLVDFSQAKIVVDVGGGHGTFMAGLLRLVPHLKAIVFDLPQVVSTVQQSSIEDVQARISYVGGNFLEKVPEGGDIYVLKSVTHNWDDDDVVKILESIQKVLPPHGKVLDIGIVPEEVGDVVGAILDFGMQVLLKGKERTENQQRDVFKRAGLKLLRVIPLSGTPFFAFEGERM